MAVVSRAGAAMCPCCHGYGVYPTYPSVCWYCNGTGEDHLAEPVAPAPVSDRVEHLRRIGQTGGMTTFDRYGSNHMRAIGKAGYAATVANHGEAYAAALLASKGWTPRRPDLLSDLRAGRALAALDRAA